MAKGKQATVFFCQECGYESSKWLGQCPGCKQWNTFVEEKVRTSPAPGMRGAGASFSHVSGKNKPVKLREIASGSEERFSTRMEEMDRVLGGGVVKGSLVLVGGDPGIGKSTLLLQVCRHLAEDKKEVLYISGEESLQQIRLRAERLGSFSDSLSLLCETNVDEVEEAVRKYTPAVVIIDSIQTMYQEQVGSAPGSVSQVREFTGRFLQLANGGYGAVFRGGQICLLSHPAQREEPFRLHQ